MCLRDSELKNAAERVCNGYSKLSNVATAEVVHTHSLEHVVDIGRRPVVQDSSREASCIAAEDHTKLSNVGMFQGQRAEERHCWCHEQNSYYHANSSPKLQHI